MPNHYNRSRSAGDITESKSDRERILCLLKDNLKLERDIRNLTRINAELRKMIPVGANQIPAGQEALATGTGLRDITDFAA